MISIGVFSMSDMRGERLQVMLSPDELTAIDDFRFKHRMPTRAAVSYTHLTLPTNREV